jgi:hypothetical protein
MRSSEGGGTNGHNSNNGSNDNGNGNGSYTDDNGKRTATIDTQVGGMERKKIGCFFLLFIRPSIAGVPEGEV